MNAKIFKLLQGCCSKDPTRPNLARPFTQKGFAYATNGVIALKVEAPFAAGTTDSVGIAHDHWVLPNTEAPPDMNYVWSQRSAVARHAPLQIPIVRAPQEVPISFDNGLIFFGRTKNRATLDLRVLAPLAPLKKLELHVPEDWQTPFFFTAEYDGRAFEGAIMGMRP